MNNECNNGSSKMHHLNQLILCHCISVYKLSTSRHTHPIFLAFLFIFHSRLFLFCSRCYILLFLYLYRRGKRERERDGCVVSFRFVVPIVFAKLRQQRRLCRFSWIYKRINLPNSHTM